MNNPLAELNLPAAIRSQATRLLGDIAHARDLSDLLRAADRAEGFVLGVETVRALAPSTSKIYTACLPVLLWSARRL